MLCALLSGLSLALAYPRPDFSLLAWFALVPLFASMQHKPFRSGFVAGIAFFAVVLYWLNIVMTTYGRMHPFFSGAAYLLLVLYLSLFIGAVTWAACRLRERKGFSYVLTLPVLWVAFEYLRSFLLSGFPWALLGYSQQGWAAMIQSADLMGVYGISFLIVLFNAALAQLFVQRRQAGGRISWFHPALAVLLVALNLGYGFWRLQQSPEERSESLRVALVQGNIEQSMKWEPSHQQQTVDIYRRLSLQAEQEAKVDLIVWPESATPFYFQEDRALSRRVRQVANLSDSYLLLGSPAYERVGEEYRYLNSAFLLSPQAEVLGRSDKIHLVPFGEYVPFKKLLPFIDKMVVGIGDFSPGKVNPLPMNGSRIGVLVCFEGIFPELARNYVRKGSELLVNITNDAWFGRSSAPSQHLAMTRFRAVENRIWLVRAANTGISAIISPAGKIAGTTQIFEEAYLAGTVGLGASPTIYTRYGDILPAIFLVVTATWLVTTQRHFLAKPRVH